MRILILALLVACGGGGSKPKPIANTGSATPPAVPAKPTSKFAVEMRARPASGAAIEGVVRDVATKEALAGVTITVTSPALQGAQTAITDDEGKFMLASLPPGDYELTAYYGELTAGGTLHVEPTKVAAVTLDLDTKAQPEIVQIQPEEPKFATAIEALRKGATGQAIRLGREELKKKPSSQLHGILAISTYAFAIEVFRVEGFAFAGRDKKAADTKKAAVELLAAFDETQQHLAEAAKDPKFALELCVACMAAEDGFYYVLGQGALDIEHDRAGNELPEGDKRRRPTYRFDHGDLAWARAMVHYQQALVNVALAYDWEWLEHVDEMGKSITIKLVEPARIAKAKEHVLAGLVASDEARMEFLAETDDDREWVPSPKQKNYASPLSVDAALYKSWEDVVADVRTLVTGDTGIKLESLWALFGEKGAPGGFIDVRAMFEKPKDIVFELGSIDRIEIEKNPTKRGKLMTTFLQGVLGNGFKKQMKTSPLTQRLMQLRKDRAADEKRFEDKLKYVLWLN